jgi:hypothetical protein
MPTTIKMRIKDVKLNQAVNTAKELPIENSQDKDVRYCKEDESYYMFNGVRWIAIELIGG